jgi:hypothetical protein
MSTARRGEQGPGEPGFREPGLDHLIKALTADGYPRELAGRDAALAAFRTVSRQPRRRSRFSFSLSWSRPLTTSARLSAVTAALVAAIGGFTAAAYAQVLPAPVQHIAYSVLAPIGVPDSPSSASPVRSGAHPRSAPGAPARHVHGAASPPASCPCPARTSSRAIAGSALVLSVARAQLPADGTGVFSGKLTYHGHPEPGVQVRLLEQAATAPGWRVVATRVTGRYGGVRFRVPYLTQNAAFLVTVPDRMSSAQVTVTVIPRVLLSIVPGHVTDRLVASARFGDPGDVVVLQELSGGAWRNVATQTLGAGHRAIFKVPASASPGPYYRTVLAATGAHGPGVSGLVRRPRTLGTGAKAVVPTPQPTLAASSLTASPTPSPSPSSPTPSPSIPPQPSPTSPTPSPSIPPLPSPTSPTGSPDDLRI